MYHKISVFSSIGQTHSEKEKGLNNNCDRLRENRAQRGMRRCRKKIDLVLKIVLNKPNEGNG